MYQKLDHIGPFHLILLAHHKIPPKGFFPWIFSENFISPFATKNSFLGVFGCFLYDFRMVDHVKSCLNTIADHDSPRFSFQNAFFWLFQAVKYDFFMVK